MHTSHRITALEGLRGIAACMVLLGHLRLTFFVTTPPEFSERMSVVPPLLAWPVLRVMEGLYNGTFAVWLFWIMSGFVLSFQFFVRAHDSSPLRAHDYLEEALVRRYPRLLPPVLASVIFAYSLHAMHLMHNGIVGRLPGPTESTWLAGFYDFPASAWAAFKCAVWQTFFEYDYTTTYNAVLWSMEKEFYGSLFLFAFLALAGQRRSRIFLYPLLIVVLGLLRVHWLNAFVGGILLCDLYVHRDAWKGRLRGGQKLTAFLRDSKGAAVLLWLLLIGCTARPLGDEVFYIPLGVLAIVLALFSAPSQRILSSPVPLFLGRISFGLYLIHHPLICSFSCWLYLSLLSEFRHLGAASITCVLTCFLSIVLGWLLYLVADRPAIRLSRRLSSLVTRHTGS